MHVHFVGACAVVAHRHGRDPGDLVPPADVADEAAAGVAGADVAGVPDGAELIGVQELGPHCTAFFVGYDADLGLNMASNAL